MTMQNIALSPARRAAMLRQAQQPRRKAVRWTAGKMILAAVLAAVLAGSAFAAAIPALRAALESLLGGLAPMSQTFTGISTEYDGIEIRLVSALSDSGMTRVYAEVQDKTGDRLSPEMRINARIEGLYENAVRDSPDQILSSVVGTFVRAYDAQTRTALVEVSQDGLELPGNTPITVSFQDFQPVTTIRSALPQDVLTDTLLETFTPDDLDILQQDDTGALLPLRPEQTPRALEDTDLVALSSLGFAADGWLHVQFRITDRAFSGETGKSLLVTPRFHSGAQPSSHQIDALTFTHDGARYYELVFPGFAAAHADDIFIDEVYGAPHIKAPVEGEWSLDATVTVQDALEYDVSAQAGGALVTHVRVSPITIAVKSENDGFILFGNRPAYVRLRDGTQRSLTNNTVTAGADAAGSYDLWTFDTPIEPADVVSIHLDGVAIPLQ